MTESDAAEIFSSIELSVAGAVIVRRGGIYKITYSARAAAILIEAQAQIEEHIASLEISR
ncbi:hypothetical protein ACFO4O_11650 [Glaciecola siphonariae]|uniref:Uncharacterized protein n=1 Tax=Glaciecola siphonariae TaxID=521012 RepID=A0ABV9LY66_9ALTE